MSEPEIAPAVDPLQLGLAGIDESTEQQRRGAWDAETAELVAALADASAGAAERVRAHREQLWRTAERRRAAMERRKTRAGWSPQKRRAIERIEHTREHHEELSQARRNAGSINEVLPLLEAGWDLVPFSFTPATQAEMVRIGGKYMPGFLGWIAREMHQFRRGFIAGHRKFARLLGCHWNMIPRLGRIAERYGWLPGAGRTAFFDRRVCGGLVERSTLYSPGLFLWGEIEERRRRQQTAVLHSLSDREFKHRFDEQRAAREILNDRSVSPPPGSLITQDHRQCDPDRTSPEIDPDLCTELERVGVAVSASPTRSGALRAPQCERTTAAPTVELEPPFDAALAFEGRVGEETAASSAPPLAPSARHDAQAPRSPPADPSDCGKRIGAFQGQSKRESESRREGLSTDSRIADRWSRSVRTLVYEWSGTRLEEIPPKFGGAWREGALPDQVASQVIAELQLGKAAS